MEYRHITTALLLSSLAFAAACDDDDDDGTNPPPPQFANVRVVNASSLPANANVNLLAGGQSLTQTAVAFGTQSAACVRVPVGTTQLAFRATGGTSDIATAAAPSGGFQADQNYTVVLFGNTGGAAASAIVLSDPALTASANNNQLRFVNATNSAGNVFVTDANATITATTTPSVSNLGPGTANTGGTGGFATFPTTNSRVRLFNTNATTFTAPRVDVTLGTGNRALNANRVGTVILTEATTGTPAANATFVSTPCS